MYAVIFRAKINELDEQYAITSSRLRALAMENYGCIEFVSLTEGDQEVAISYWPDLENIRQWKQNAEHLHAQALGRTKWYKTYSVQIVEIINAYKKP